MPSLKKIAPDIIHAHFGPEAALIAEISARLSIPFVVTFYGYDASLLPKDPTWRKSYSAIWRHASGVIVLSECMRKSLATLGCPASRLHVVHLARNLRGILKKTTPCRVRRFVSVGRFVEKKGHADSIRAFQKVFARHPDARFDIIGDGPLLSKMRALVEELKLAGAVRLRGALPNDEVLEAMRESDAFLLASRTSQSGDEEGTPTVLVEAQSLGLPCISTFHAGIPEMIPPRNHFLLADEGDVERIAQCMFRLMDAEQKELTRIIEAGEKHALQNFNIESETRKLERVYRTVLSQKQTSPHSGRENGVRR